MEKNRAEIRRWDICSVSGRGGLAALVLSAT